MPPREAQRSEYFIDGDPHDGNVNTPDGSGATPLELARSRGYHDMVAILEKSGAK